MVWITKRNGNRKLTIGVSTMPYRKKLCLVVEEGNELTKYATSNNEKSAYSCMDLFAEFMGVERIDLFGRADNEKR